MPDAVIERCRAQLEQVAANGLSTARAEGDLASVLREMDAIVTRALAGDAAAKVACRPGCASCCAINVGTLAVEGAVVAGFLRRALGPGELEAFARRLSAFHADVRWLEDRERVRGGFRCPFLDARRACRIHAVRPLACRSVTSLDAGDCGRALSGDDEDGPPVVRMHALQKALYDEAIDALRRAIRARGLDGRCRDVTGMTALFLASPDPLAGYLAGAELPLD